MSDGAVLGGLPLRRRLLAITLACAAMLLVALVALFTASERQRRALTEASRSLVEEQHIADQVTGGVMRQLAITGAGSRADPVAMAAAFEAASVSVHDGLRAYLFRDLSVSERRQVEQIKERHELLEVTARRLQQLGTTPGSGQRSALRNEVTDHALELLDAMSAFFRLREADLSSAAESQAAALRWLWVTSALIALVVGLGIWYLLTRFLRLRVVAPLAALADAADRVGQGDLAVRVPVEGDRELRELAADFNVMTGRLAEAQGVLANRNADLEAALDLVRRAQDDLVQSEKLGALGRMSAGLAHELNNPLASVIGHAELLAAEVRDRGQLSDTAAAELVEPILREGTRARQLVQSLLQFSRQADAGISSVVLADALAVVADLRRFAFERRGLRLVIDPVPPVAVRAEQQRLQAVFMNIVNNALQAMEPQEYGTLQVHAVVDGDVAEIRFDDNGPGIREPERVFEPFYTTKDVGEGTGLGLALAARFVESFGGTIRAENRPSRGARLVIRLPVAEAATAISPEDAPPAADLAGRTVLVVEDEPDLRRLQVRLLGRIGVTVETAGSLAEALQRLGSSSIDAVVSDVRMPGGSGVDLYRWVEQERPDLASRFLFVTGDIDVAELGSLLASRPGIVLHKPFGMAEYVRRVEELLGG